MKLALLILYFGVMVGIGLYCRKHTSGINGFVLGGAPWPLAHCLCLWHILLFRVVFVGYAGQFGWKYGIAATWAGIGNAILGSLLAWAVLGRRTRILTQHYNSATMPQFFGQRFQSKSLKIGASVIVFVFLIPYTASLFNGLSRLFGMAFHMDYTVCIILMGVLTGIYVDRRRLYGHWPSMTLSKAVSCWWASASSLPPCSIPRAVFLKRSTGWPRFPIQKP